MDFLVTAPDGILNMATGRSWHRGQYIAADELTPEYRAALLADGAIESTKPKKAKRAAGEKQNDTT